MHEDNKFAQGLIGSLILPRLREAETIKLCSKIETSASAILEIWLDEQGDQNSGEDTCRLIATMLMLSALLETKARLATCSLANSTSVRCFGNLYTSTVIENLNMMLTQHKEEITRQVVKLSAPTLDELTNQQRKSLKCL